MRLTIIGSLSGNLTTASKIAMDRGTKVTHAHTIETALKELASGQGADLIMIEVSHDIALLITCLANEHIHVPVVACGTDQDARAAVKAIQAGAKEYIPLPPDAELIAAILEAVSKDNQSYVFKDIAMTNVVALADQVASSEASHFNHRRIRNWQRGYGPLCSCQIKPRR